MRRMISQKQIEGLDNLNKAIVPDQWGVNIVPNQYGYASVAFGDDDQLSLVIGFNDVGTAAIEVSDDNSDIAGGGIWINRNGSIQMWGNGATAPMVTFGKDGTHIFAEVDKTYAEIAKITPKIIHLETAVPASGKDCPINLATYNSEGDNTAVVNLSKDGLYISGDGDGTNAGHIYVLQLPTSDPHLQNALWNDNGTLKISLGN